MVGSVTPGFAMKTLGCTGGQGWSTGLLVQLNLGPQAMDKPWASRDQEQRDSTGRAVGMQSLRVQGGFLLCKADNAAFL